MKSFLHSIPAFPKSISERPLGGEYAKSSLWTLVSTSGVACRNDVEYGGNCGIITLIKGADISAMEVDNLVATTFQSNSVPVFDY
jgi:hypothetical protein